MTAAVSLTLTVYAVVDSGGMPLPITASREWKVATGREDSGLTPPLPTAFRCIGVILIYRTRVQTNQITSTVGFSYPSFGP